VGEPSESEPTGDAPSSDEDEPSSAVTSATKDETPYRGRAAGGAEAKKKDGPTLWQRATYRWTAITAVLAALLVLYTQHPYYQGGQFAPFRPAYTAAFVVWLVFGLFYVRATLRRFAGMRYTMRDGGLHLILVARTASFAFGGKALKAGLAIAAGGGALWALDRNLIHGGTLETAGQIAGVAGGLVAFASIPMRLAAHQKETKRFFRLFKNHRIRTTGLLMIVKAFYIPLMTGFVSGHTTAICDAWLRHKHLAPLRFNIPHGNALGQAYAWFVQMSARLPDLLPASGDFTGLFSPSTWTAHDVSWLFDLLYNVVFFVDCGWALMGYSLESRWLGNKTRSVEPTAFGWFVALACYPPFNNALGTYLPLDSSHRVIHDGTWLLVFRGVTIFLFAIYASATVAFGFKFSNLTNRGVVARGPYRFVRHPAYLCKCTAWWLEHLPTISVTKAFFLSLLCGVYALRAWTEERHLSKDPEYLAYKKKVPWVLFPGVY
jgi:protein-S-isoprenylcysteine O-methyltransferase Ste14